MQDKIILSTIKPLATGHKRVVYQHPHDERLLIKIVPGWKIEQRWGANVPWYRRLRRSSIYTSFYREVGEYICLRAREPEFTGAMPKIIGFADTDLGMGMVVEKLVGEKGEIAPTLKTLLLEGGFTAELSAELDRLIQELLRFDVILTKLNTRNIVLAYDRKHGRRFAIIDGFGQKNAIPLQIWSRAYNRFKTRRNARHLYREIEHLIAERARQQTGGGALAKAH